MILIYNLIIDHCFSTLVSTICKISKLYLLKATIEHHHSDDNDDNNNSNDNNNNNKASSWL